MVPKTSKGRKHAKITCNRWFQVSLPTFACAGQGSRTLSRYSMS